MLLTTTAKSPRQAIMVVLVIAFPVTVTGLLDAPLKVDLDKIKIEVPEIDRWISASPSSKRSHRGFRDRRIIVTISI